jgi:GR25 family glycosyltransferase involved in LPS biosynthesis
MTNTNTSWDNIYTVVINLAKEKERKSFMENQLTSYGIPHVFLDATNGYSYDFSNICDDSISITKNGNALSLPEKGCALSHRCALEMFLSSGKTYGLILEDDIDIDSSFKRAIESEVLSHANKWTYLQFNYMWIAGFAVVVLFLHDNKVIFFNALPKPKVLLINNKVCVMFLSFNRLKNNIVRDHILLGVICYS